MWLNIRYALNIRSQRTRRAFKKIVEKKNPTNRNGGECVTCHRNN